MESWQLYTGNEVLAEHRRSGRLIDFSPAESADASGIELGEHQTLARHPRAPLPNYPHEWAPAMLRAAAELTLDLAESLLDDGVLLKDASPYNVMYFGPAPVFIDALSFEKKPPASSLWLPESQFLRTFVFPLLYWTKLRVPTSSIFLAAREGLTAEQVYRVLSPIERLYPRYLVSVTLPAAIDRRSSGEWAFRGVEVVEAPPHHNEEQVRAILQSVFRRLRRLLRVVDGEVASSHWSMYIKRQHYPDAATEMKRRFVAESLSKVQSTSVLDVGCNLGEFTEIAARQAAVVAIDSDPEVIGSLWRTARERGWSLLPLVQDFAAPSPSLGWQNAETPSFLERARGRFDCVMMLAVIHHLLVTSRIPLRQVIGQAADLTRKALIIEYVGPSDPMFRAIAKGRNALHAELNRSAFEAALLGYFEILHREDVPGMDRAMYLAARRG